MADPKTVLRAANAAPLVFNIAAYFLPLCKMRQKGYSWRFLADWLKKFNIEISHVHLHRLYIKEDARLNRLNVEQLRQLGFPADRIAKGEADLDPTKRLVAADPEDEPDEGEEDERP